MTTTNTTNRFSLLMVRPTWHRSEKSWDSHPDPQATGQRVCGISWAQSANPGRDEASDFGFWIEDKNPDAEPIQNRKSQIERAYRPCRSRSPRNGSSSGME